MKKRMFSIITALALCLSLGPAWALAAEGEDTPSGEGCPHSYQYTPGENTGTHTKTCSLCGDTGSESCTYPEGAYEYDDAGHWQTCTLCGGQKREAHVWTSKTRSNRLIRMCGAACDWEEDIGSLTVTPDFSVLSGHTAGVKLTHAAALKDGYELQLQGGLTSAWRIYTVVVTPDGMTVIAKVLGQGFVGELPEDLAAGRHVVQFVPDLYYHNVYAGAVLATVTVTVEDKFVPTLTVSPIAHVYNGEAPAVTGTAIVNGGNVPGTWSFQGPAPVNVADSGEKTVVFTPNDSENYASATAQVQVTITPKPLSGTPTFTGGGSGKTLADVTHTLPQDWPQGTFAWTDGDSTAIEQGKEYGCTFTPDSGNYQVYSGTEILWARPSGGGSSSGGSGGGSSSSTTTRDPDGTTTTTTTDRRTGTVTETTRAPGGASVTVVTDREGNVTSARASVPAGKEQVTLPAAVEKGTEMEITVRGGGSARVEIPAEGVTPGTVAVIVSPDGSETVVRKCVPTEGGVALTVEGSAVVKLAEAGRSFSDLPETHWAADAAAFVSARGLFKGTEPGVFSPGRPMTRAMLAVVLHNLENNPAQALTGTFGDVDDSQWYAEGVAWAAEQGIVSGYGGGQFGPNDNITREQLAVMLWRYAGKPAPPNLLLSFDDADRISPWADNALRWAVDRGILNGKGGGILDPKGTATRAEAAQMLKNFLEKLF